MLKKRELLRKRLLHIKECSITHIRNNITTIFLLRDLKCKDFTNKWKPGSVCCKKLDCWTTTPWLWWEGREKHERRPSSIRSTVFHAIIRSNSCFLDCFRWWNAINDITPTPFPSDPLIEVLHDGRPGSLILLLQWYTLLYYSTTLPVSMLTQISCPAWFPP